MFRSDRPLTSAVGSALVVVGSWLWGVAVSAAPTEDDGVPISFALEKPSVTLHEPVFVELRIENRLAEQVTFDLGFNEKANFHFILAEPTGSKVSRAAFGKEASGHRSHFSQSGEHI